MTLIITRPEPTTAGIVEGNRIIAEAYSARCTQEGVSDGDAVLMLTAEHLVTNERQPAEAQRIYDTLGDAAKNSTFAAGLRELLDEEAFYNRAEEAMADAIITGACKMSRSGQTVIFRQAQCGRQDLSGIRRIAEQQLTGAGLTA